MYSPKIKEHQVRALYQLKKKVKKPMTVLVEQALNEYLNKTNHFYIRRTTMKIQEVYNKITAQIQEKLKEGTLPWKKPWTVGLPQNMISRHYYTGINFLSLCTADYPSPYYLTFLQCKDKEGYVNPGKKEV